MKKYLLLVVLGGVLVFLSCKKDKALTSQTECSNEVSFATDVKPIIELNCSTSGCHDASGAGGYNLSTYTGISINADAVYQAMNHDSGFQPMPLGGNKLPDSTIQNIYCWIQQGKKDN